MSNKIKVMIPAYRILEKTKGGGEIERYVNQHLALIEADIEDALENEISFAKTELDTTFAVPYMTNQQAQRDVYYHTAQALLKSGYQPRLKFFGRRADTQKVFIVVRWANQQEQRIDTYKDEFIRQITINDADRDQITLPHKPKIPSMPVGKYPRPNPDSLNKYSGLNKLNNLVLKK